MRNIKFIGIIAVILLCVVSLYVQYTHEEFVTAKVNRVVVQQRISGNSDAVSTSYSYLVATDKGTFRICPDGIFASSDFGSLEDGKTYRLHTRGMSYPLFGIYPYIIKAREQ